MPRKGFVSVTLVAAAVAAALMAASSGSPRGEATPERDAQLQAVLDSLVTGPKRIAPGATAYVSGPHGTWIGSAGLADAATGARMRPDARTRLESVGKLWTAVLVLRLVQERKLSLDDTVARRLPGLLPYGNRVTLRQLLNHTSGMVDTNDIVNHPARYLGQVEDEAQRARFLKLSKRLEKDPGYEFSSRIWVDLAAALPLFVLPGTAFHYSNIGYIVAGLMAERAGGQSLPALFRREIISPLHLTSAAYDPHSRISGPHARGYSVAANGKLTDTTTWTTGLGANGGIVSNAADEARFLTALMQGRLLKPAQLRALEKPSGHSNYGLGTGVDESGCAGTAYGHNGAGDGFASSVYVSPDGRRVAVLLLNGRPTNGRGDRPTFEAMRRLYCAA